MDLQVWCNKLFIEEWKPYVYTLFAALRKLSQKPNLCSFAVRQGTIRIGPLIPSSQIIAPNRSFKDLRIFQDLLTSLKRPCSHPRQRGTSRARTRGSSTCSWSMTWRTSSTLLVALILKCQKPAKTPLSVRKVYQVIPGGQQEERFWVVHHIQGEHYQTF